MEMTVNGKNYQVLRLLGKGKGGYSYLAARNGMEYVLKQIHHEPCAYYTFGNKIEAECRDYERLTAAGILLPKMLDVDIENERILKEYIPGDTIYEHVRKGTLQPAFLDDIRRMCALLYPIGLNIDYFPTNFIPWNDKLYYIDYECNAYSDEWNFENWGIRYWSRTPEFEQYEKEHTAPKG